MVEPYLLHFVVRNVEYTLTASGVIVTCYTNYPVHLWKRETTTQPQKHVNTRMVRGAPIGTYIDQCFVVYTDHEQQEPGDTFTHTFIQEPWPFCETRWFYFWGTVGGELSPSCSAIFSYHRIKPETTTFRIYAPWYWRQWQYRAPTWIATWSNPTGELGLVQYYSWAGFHWWTDPVLTRGALYFDLTSLPPGKLILSCCLTIRLNPWKYANGGQTWAGDWQILLNWPNPPAIFTTSDYGTIRMLTDVIAWWYYARADAPTHVEQIELPPSTLAIMQDKPKLVIAQRCGRDFFGSAPSIRTTFAAQAWCSDPRPLAWIDVEVEK